MSFLGTKKPQLSGFSVIRNEILTFHPEPINLFSPKFIGLVNVIFGNHLHQYPTSVYVLTVGLQVRVTEFTREFCQLFSSFNCSFFFNLLNQKFLPELITVFSKASNGSLTQQYTVKSKLSIIRIYQSSHLSYLRQGCRDLLHQYP